MKNPFIALFFLIISTPVFALDYGIDRLNDPTVMQKLQGKRLAVLTHAAGKNKNQQHLIDLLFKNYNLKKIFAPEHGLRTMADDWVADGIDEATGLPVISLYKRGSKAPNAADLTEIDTVVIDLQDVGVRYYTYFSTIAAVMNACAPLGIEVILLDRPNLLGGKIMEGKVLDANLAGNFTAYHTVPTRHGMTLGELARMINVENKMNVKLTVIPVTGWKRENLLKNMERSWIAPSPALLQPDQVGLYALWGTMENFNLAVGRGLTNELAFKVIGAPWITEQESITLSKKLNQLGFRAAKFIPFSWTVTRALYTGKKVNGVKIIWTGNEIRTDEFTYKVAALLIKMFSNRISSSQMSPYAYGGMSMVNAIRNGTSWSVFAKTINSELSAFKIRRAKFLLY